MTVETLPWESWNPAKIRKPVIKPVIKALDWAEVIRGTIPTLAKDSRKLLSRVSDGLGFLTLPGKGKKLLKSFTLAYSSETIAEKAINSVEALDHSTTIVGAGAGAVETMHETGLFTLTAFQLFVLTSFGFICSSILVVKTLVDINKTFTKITQQELWSPEFNSSLLSIAGKICRLAIGLLAMAFFLVGSEIVAPVVILTLSSFCLLFSLSKRLYRM